MGTLNTLKTVNGANPCNQGMFGWYTVRWVLHDDHIWSFVRSYTHAWVTDFDQNLVKKRLFTYPIMAHIYMGMVSHI